jgi:hypothetical protein
VEKKVKEMKKVKVEKKVKEMKKVKVEKKVKEMKRKRNKILKESFLKLFYKKINYFYY